MPDLENITRKKSNKIDFRNGIIDQYTQNRKGSYVDGYKPSPFNLYSFDTKPNLVDSNFGNSPFGIENCLKNSLKNKFMDGNDLEMQDDPFYESVWGYTEQVWTKEDWRVVGSKKRSNSVCEPLINRKNEENRKMSEIYIEEPIFGEAFYLTTSKKFENMSVNDILKFLDDTLFVIEFNSGRMDIAYVSENNDKISYDVNHYVIIEADRGEDCGKILAITSKEKYKKLLNRINEVTKEVQPKRIFRKAMRKDMELMKRKQHLEEYALGNCKKRVIEKGLEMEVVGCEYQWDMHKLTFFFVSDKRVDFRELVKELYKVYKTRIWMCAVEKSKNCYLRELL